MELTAEALEAHRRKERRAFGRTPEEYAALEEALARRRVRKQARDDLEVRRQLLAHDQRLLAEMEQQLAQAERNLAYERALLHQDQEELARDEEELRKSGAREAQRHERVLTPEASGQELSGWREVKIKTSPREVGVYEEPKGQLEIAIHKMREIIEGEELGLDVRAPLPPPSRQPPLPGMGGGFRKKATPTMRSVRGSRWHRSGYRDHGDMWINVQFGKEGYIRGRDVGENYSLRSFVREVLEDAGTELAIPADWRRDVHFRKRSLVRALVDHEDGGAPDWAVIMRNYFNGGETVYFKAFDESGAERTIDDMM